MKIALVSPYDYAYPGGVNSHITPLYHHFKAMGHEVRIIAPSSQPQESFGNPDILVCGKPVSVPASGSVARITLSLRLATRVKAILEREQFDVVHLHEPLMPMLPITVLRFSTAVNVGTFHAHRDRSLAYLYTRRLLKRWFKKLDGKIAVSRPAADFVSQYFPGYYNIIPNGIDLDHFNPDIPPLPEYCDGKYNILFVGRFEKRKGLRYLVRAYARVKAELPNTRLLIVGPDGGLRQGYERSILKAGLPDVVFTGYVPYEELPRYYRTAHVFCSPATGQESQGYVLLEAIACGAPVVASNIEGYASVVTHNEEGLLVPPKNDEKLALTLVHLLADKELRTAMGHEGVQTAQGYSWKRIAQKVISYYERLMEERMPVQGQQEKRAVKRPGRSRWRALLPPFARRRLASTEPR